MPTEHELEQAIRELQLTTSVEFDDRVLTDASARMSRNNAAAGPLADRTATITPQPLLSVRETPPSSRLLRRVVLSIAILAMLLVFGVWWFPGPTNSWAQVVQAVQEKPWIHLVGKTSDGDDVEGWFSTKHQVFADRFPGHISFSDFQTGRAEYYNPGTGEVLRSETDAQSSRRKSFDAFTSLFQGVLRGDQKLDVEKTFGRMPDIQQIEQSRKEITNDEGRWFEYELTFHETDHKPGRMSIRVDAASMLPKTMTLVDGGGEQSRSITFHFEFPESGPADIYELGVPRDAKIVDHTPQSLDGKIKEIVDGIRATAEGFDDYRAISVISEPDLPWHVGTPLLVWRSGARTRLEMGSVDPDNPPPSQVPDDRTDRARWWKGRCKQLWFLPVEVSDGKTLYQNRYLPPGHEPGPMNGHPLVRSPAQWVRTDWKSQPEPRTWPARTAPIVWAYPQNLSGYAKHLQYPTEVVTDPDDAPPGAVQVMIRWTSETENPAANYNNEVEYLVDPGRSFVVLRSSTTTSVNENGHAVVQSQLRQSHEDLRQSPKGFWYPGLIRTEQTYQQNGKPVTTINVMRYYLDFDVEVSDDLFQPQERKTRGFPE